MAESSELTWEYNNVFILKYVPQNLKWYEKDGLDVVQTNKMRRIFK